MKKKSEIRHCDLDLWPKVTKINRVWASSGSNHLAKTASKSVHPFGWNFVHKNFGTDTHTHTDRHTDKLQWKYNPSTISWRCKKKKKKERKMLLKFTYLNLNLYWLMMKWFKVDTFFISLLSHHCGKVCL